MMILILSVNFGKIVVCKSRMYTCRLARLGRRVLRVLQVNEVLELRTLFSDEGREILNHLRLIVSRAIHTLGTSEAVRHIDLLLNR